MCVDLCLGFQVNSLDQCVSYCTNTMLFLLLWV